MRSTRIDVVRPVGLAGRSPPSAYRSFDARRRSRGIRRRRTPVIDPVAGPVDRERTWPPLTGPTPLFEVREAVEPLRERSPDRLGASHSSRQSPIRVRTTDSRISSCIIRYRSRLRDGRAVPARDGHTPPRDGTDDDRCRRERTTATPIAIVLFRSRDSRTIPSDGVATGVPDRRRTRRGSPTAAPATRDRQPPPPATPLPIAAPQSSQATT